MKSCKGKQCYGKNEAHRVKNAAMRVRNRKIRTYECTICGFWHLTSYMDGHI